MKAILGKKLKTMSIVYILMACKTSTNSSSDSESLSTDAKYQRSEVELGSCSEKFKKYQKEQGNSAIVAIVGSVGFFVGPAAIVFGPLVAAITGSVGGSIISAESSAQRKNLCGLEDLDFAKYPGDWSLRRIKRSCPPYFPVAGAKHVSNMEINLGCSDRPLSSPEVEKMLKNAENKKNYLEGIILPKYRFVENGSTNLKWGYSLDCEKNEYVAGISFGATDSNYGIKSILCGQLPSGRQEKTCKYRGDNTEECEAGQYMKGMYVQRGYRNGNVGRFVGEDATKRADDALEYGDQIKGVSCCSL